MDTERVISELEENLRELYDYYPSKKEKLWMIAEIIDYVKKNHEKNSQLCVIAISYVLRNYEDYLEKNFSINNASFVLDNLDVLRSELEF
jgi:hypothetical protein